LGTRIGLGVVQSFVIDPHSQTVGQPVNVDGITADHGIAAARIAFFEHLRMRLSARC
jgi:hypothetical protein